MKTLREYIAESQEWMHTPAEGDVFAFELSDEVLCETYIIEVVDDCILLDSTPEINAALAEWAKLEDTDEGDSGVIMETMGYGSLVGEGQMKRQMMTNAESMNLEQFTDLYGDDEWVIEFWKDFNEEPEEIEDVDEGNIQDLEKNIASAAVKPIPMEEEEMDEAEYQGRKVPLNKPMRGDQAKFKVYVRDPKTGNVKKVNFGHGGKSAKRAGQKTMRIRKSNPKARKSFRARHRCDNPGSKLKARYWSCRAW
jgi:hypothetical protein